MTDPNYDHAVSALARALVTCDAQQVQITELEKQLGESIKETLAEVKANAELEALVEALTAFVLTVPCDESDCQQNLCVAARAVLATLKPSAAKEGA